jgi:2,3-bisphosphoglycerate-independent phosphoglycerate mutase
VAHAYNSSYSGGRDQENCGQPRHIVHETLSQKKPNVKKAGRVAQVVECLLSKSEALSSNSSITKKKKKSPKNCETWDI